MKSLHFAIWISLFGLQTALGGSFDKFMMSRDLRDTDRETNALLHRFSIQQAKGSVRLSEYLGDTVIVGVSSLDNQHNILHGRTIGIDSGFSDEETSISMVYTFLSQDNGQRNVRFNRVRWQDDIPSVDFAGGTVVSYGQRGGYATLGVSRATDPIAIPTYHDRLTASDPWEIRVAGEVEFIPGLFNESGIVAPAGISMSQSKVASGANDIVHIVGAELADSPRRILYARVGFDRENSTFTILNPNGEAEIISDRGYTNNVEVATGVSGDKVVVAKTFRRFDLGRVEDDLGFDNDLILFVNTGSGVDWDWSLENALNVTQFEGPDRSLLPDTVAANQDTFRVSYDYSVFIDENDVVHVAFTVLPYYHIQDSATILSHIYYWNEVDNQLIKIADGNFWINARGPTLDTNVEHPSLYRDPDTGILWCLYQQYGEPGDTLADGTPNDAGANTGRLNSDLWLTASPAGDFNGKLWYTGINITDTRGTGGAIPSGECKGERDASISLRNDGDYLNIVYLLDLDAGNSNNDTEGDVTENPIVYQRISKSEALDQMRANQSFVRGYPMHADSSGFWQDPLEWVWRDLDSVDEPDKLLASEFQLEGVYPNPFNASTRLKFELRRSGHVDLKVFDLTGREVATLVSRVMDQGNHEVLFEGSGLSSGVYFVSLGSGSEHHFRKMVLIK